jgi:hypothetical protein
MGRVAGLVPERAAMWLGHYSTVLLLAAVATSVADDATGQSQGALEWAASAVWLAWIAAFTADIGRHQERLCERCIAASPLDPQAAVTRWRGVLRLHHARRAGLALLGGIIAWDVVNSLFRHPPAWALAIDALTAVVLGASYAVTWQHRRLYPWCPFCRWGEGGAHEVSPDVPSPSAARLRKSTRTQFRPPPDMKTGGRPDHSGTAVRHGHSRRPGGMSLAGARKRKAAVVLILTGWPAG